MSRWDSIVYTKKYSSSVAEPPTERMIAFINGR